MLKLPIILCIFYSLFSIGQEEEKFTYQEHAVLKWSDFKKEPDLTSIHHATANTGMGYDWSYRTSNGKMDLTYNVDSHFYPQLSWVNTAQADAYLLAHEQLHFDISELHARMLRKSMSEYHIGRNIRRDLKTMYEKAETNRRAMQTAYDIETNHSIDSVAQKKWNIKVKELLEAHATFAK